MEETHKPPYESCWSLKVIQVAANRRGFGLTLAVVQRICVHAKCFLCFFMHAYLRLVLWGRLFIFAKGCNVACWPCAVYTRLVRHVCVCVLIYLLFACGWFFVCVHKCTQDACPWWIQDHWWSRLLPRALVPQTVTNSVSGSSVLPRVANRQPGSKNMSSCSTCVSHSLAATSILLTGSYFLRPKLLSKTILVSSIK